MSYFKVTTTLVVVVRVDDQKKLLAEQQDEAIKVVSNYISIYLKPGETLADVGLFFKDIKQVEFKDKND